MKYFAIITASILFFSLNFSTAFAQISLPVSTPTPLPESTAPPSTTPSPSSSPIPSSSPAPSGSPTPSPSPMQSSSPTPVPSTSHEKKTPVSTPAPTSKPDKVAPVVNTTPDPTPSPTPIPHPSVPEVVPLNVQNVIKKAYTPPSPPPGISQIIPGQDYYASSVYAPTIRVILLGFATFFFVTGLTLIDKSQMSIPQSLKERIIYRRSRMNSVPILRNLL